jgi:Cu/Ag efflux pump CusA
VFDVVVWSPPQRRNDTTGLADVLIEAPAGGHVRLGDIADIRILSTPTVIRHERNSPYVDVTAIVRGRGVGAVLGDVAKRLTDVKFPLEYHPELLGEYAERSTARNRMYAVALGSTIGILLLLQSLIGSWRLSASLMVGVVASLVGGVLAALAMGGELSLGSLVGLIGILALAARQSITLIQRYQDLGAGTGRADNLELVERGSRDRLMPILTSAFVVGLALVPFIVMGSVAGFEIERPMAIVLLGGTISSTLFVLFVVPALFLPSSANLAPDQTKGVV